MRGRLLAGLALALIAPVVGCGDGERSYDAAGVVADLNEAGAGIVLGDPIEASTVGLELHSVVLTGGATPTPEGGHSHGAGALIVAEDAGTATDEFTRCESAVDFTCYRAANVVLRFTGISAAEQQRISAALQAIESG